MQLKILVNLKNQAVITDFGSARAVDSEREVTLKGAHTRTTAAKQHRLVTGPINMESLKAEVSAFGEFRREALRSEHSKAEERYIQTLRSSLMWGTISTVLPIRSKPGRRVSRSQRIFQSRGVISQA